MTPSVVVTGLGAITSIGHDVPTMWAALQAGHSGIGYISHFDASDLPARIAAEVKGFEPCTYFSAKQTRRLDRFTQFALVAAQEAIADAALTLDQICPERVGVYIGSGFGGIATLHEQMTVFQLNGQRRVSPFLIPMMIQNMAAGQVAIDLGLKGPCMSPMTACAAGTDAIGQAAEAIRRGDAEVMICGGSEAPLTPIVMAGFGAMGVLAVGNGDPTQACRPFDAEREGCVIAEGAGILVLESLDHAHRRNAHIYAELAGYGATCDANHITSPSDDGEGLARAMSMALAKAGLPPTVVSYINAHGTGTTRNDESETLAIKTTFGEHAYDLCVSSTKATVGHLIGAAGAIEAIACVKTLETQTIPPTLNYHTPDPNCDLDYVPNQARTSPIDVALTNSVGFGGHNATLAFRKSFY
jgi:3-oxoacyl-[acyl-carrier-protein] synthase II